MNKTLPPFSCVYEPSVPDLLHQLGCSIVISTYQANKLIFISPNQDDRLVQLARNFDKVMGVSIHKEGMTLATKKEVHVFNDSKPLANTYPKKPGVYDAMFMPRLSYYTGEVDIHDIHAENDQILAVNTSFSCIVKLSEKYNWEPVWFPPNITSLASEDRCHLNGMIVRDGVPVFASALGIGDHQQSWRNDIPDGGVIWDVQNNRTILEDLKMPHSPRAHGDKIYFTESATGRILELNKKNELSEIKKIKAFTRGIAIYNDYLFVGKSKIRKTSSIFRNLAMANENITPSISIIHLPSKSIVGEINYLNSVEEIYDVQILPNRKRPNILSPKDDYHFEGLMVPGATFWAKNVM